MDRALEAKRYLTLLIVRVLLVVTALVIAARAAHSFRSVGNVWLLAAIFATSAAAFFIWPILVPSKQRTWRTYSLGPAFFLAGMFLLPPAALVLSIAYAVTLAGIVAGTRGYRILTQLALAVIAYGGFSLVFDLGPRSSDYLLAPAPRAALEVAIAAAASITMLLLRSIVLRLEHGAESPNWGSFQTPALVEGLYCLVLSVALTILTRIHLGLLAVVYLEIGITWWFVRSYRSYLQDVNRLGEWQVSLALAVQEAQRPWSVITGRGAVPPVPAKGPDAAPAGGALPAESPAAEPAADPAPAEEAPAAEAPRKKRAQSRRGAP
ncbi:MAG TPA: hypothetical protein VFT32_07760 [Candidatus Eisenbacteria bacterium]|nr:hypothetical protein [Candidatus Eisenbacteria bacterium]